jgi:hypothetical protein
LAAGLVKDSHNDGILVSGFRYSNTVNRKFPSMDAAVCACEIGLPRRTCQDNTEAFAPPLSPEQHY